MMGCGGILRNQLGDGWFGFSSFEGVGEPFQDELLGLIRGLELVWKVGIRRLLCEVDNRDLYNCVQQIGPTNLHSYAELLAIMRGSINQQWEVAFRHVPQDKIKVADALAKMGLRDRVYLQVWNSPPASIGTLVGDS
ncbi:hypothetical protein OROGR_016593 [Orobanche gracilis]